MWKESLRAPSLGIPPISEKVTKKERRNGGLSTLLKKKRGKKWNSYDHPRPGSTIFVLLRGTYVPTPTYQDNLVPLSMRACLRELG